MAHMTLIVDEIPGLVNNDPDEPPGHVMAVNEKGDVVWELKHLKMPYDIARTPEGNYLVNLIRERAVWEVTPAGDVTAKYPVGGYPCGLDLLPDGHMLVAGWDDHLPGFVREFDSAGNVVWAVEDLHWPWKAQRLKNGHTLIADAGLREVFEVTGEKKKVWCATGLGPDPPRIFNRMGPVFCQRLENGHTLISIRGDSRIVELDENGRLVWEVVPGLIKMPYSAQRLENGSTLIVDGGRGRVIELTPDCEIVWEKGGLGYPAKAYRIPAGSSI